MSLRTLSDPLVRDSPVLSADDPVATRRGDRHAASLWSPMGSVGVVRAAVSVAVGAQASLRVGVAES
jgi:hypothetical protein